MEKKCDCGSTIKNDGYDKCWSCNHPNTIFEEKKTNKFHLNTNERDKAVSENDSLHKEIAKLYDRIKELELSVKDLTSKNQFLTKSNNVFKSKMANENIKQRN